MTGADGNEAAASDGIGIERFEPASDVDLSDPDLYLNRELSELEFQKRVLHEAEDDRTPLLEQVRFLSIFTRNMDEFVMKRVGGLKQQIEAGVTDRTPDGRTPQEQWAEIHDEMEPMFAAQTACYRDVVRPVLADAGIEILDYDELDGNERDDLRAYFEDSVLPTLTPLSFDPAHPFPFISNRSLSLAIMTRQSAGDDLTFTRVKIPPNRPRLVEIDGYRVDAEPHGHMLLSRNRDEPGVIGFIGRVFGEHDINIASMANARQSIDGEALTVYNLDDPVSDDVIEQLLADERIIDATRIDLDG